MKLRARSLAVVFFTLVLAFPAFLGTPAAAAAATSTTTTGQPATLAAGVVTSSPLQSMSDLNGINNINQAFSGVLSSFTTAVFIRPYYQLLTANDTFQNVDVISTQTFPANNTYILHLRNDTGWNNGQPVTAWDFAAYGTIIAGVGAPAYNYKVINNYTVSIQVPVDPAVGLYGLSVSSFIFGPDLANGPFIINYNQWAPVYRQVLANYPAIQAGNSSVIQNMSSLIFGYKTSQELFSGPYYPTTVSGSEIVLSKNPYYYNTKNLTINNIDIYQFTSANAEYQYLDAGQLSVYYAGAQAGAGTSAVPQSFVSAMPSYMQTISPGGYSGPGIFFNNATGVVSNLHVREAIAYTLNRTELAQAGGSTYTPVTLPIGMPQYMWSTMCPASCQSQMNPYGYNTTAAKDQMEAAGYTLKSGEWQYQNGTQVSLTLINTLSTDPTVLDLALDLQTQLQNFGIQVNVLNPASPGSYETSGKGFDMLLGNWGFYYTAWDVFRNLQYFNGIPYPVMHFTANVTIPINNIGVTTANGLQDLILNDAKNTTAEAGYAEGLSYLVNHYLPYLTLDNRSPVIYINTRQFNWPNASSIIWSADLAAGGTMDAVMVAQEAGQLSQASTGAATTTTATTTGAASISTGSSTAATTTTAAVSTTTALSTSVSTSTLVTTSVRTTTLVTNGGTNQYPSIIAAVVIVVVVIAIVGAMLARRGRAGTNPPPSVPPSSSSSPPTST